MQLTLNSQWQQANKPLFVNQFLKEVRDKLGVISVTLSARPPAIVTWMRKGFKVGVSENKDYTKVRPYDHEEVAKVFKNLCNAASIGARRRSRRRRRRSRCRAGAAAVPQPAPQPAPVPAPSRWRRRCRSRRRSRAQPGAVRCARYFS